MLDRTVAWVGRGVEELAGLRTSLGVFGVAALRVKGALGVSAER